jgi:hypothetical protein
MAMPWSRRWVSEGHLSPADSMTRGSYSSCIDFDMTVSRGSRKRWHGQIRINSTSVDKMPHFQPTASLIAVY